jgi:tRNA pseudouridine38-40 synthase
MPNFRLTLSYDGSRYRGWQRQGNTDNTIQAKLEETLSRILDETVECAGSGRTDAGVHAMAQTVSFRAQTKLPPEEILTQLRRYLPEDIGAQSLSLAPPRFHARLSCTGKTYVYRVWNSAAPCVFERKYVYQYPQPLNEQAMGLAAEKLLGEHDFAAFSTARTKKSTVRRIDSIEIKRTGDELRIAISGNGFLYNMVRIITGTLLEVGAGRMSPEDVERALNSQNRTQAGPTAPAKGLCLWETRY